MNFPKSMTDSKPQIQETQEQQAGKYQKTTPKNILFKLQKNKKKILKARGEWSKIIQVLEKKKKKASPWQRQKSRFPLTMCRTVIGK